MADLRFPVSLTWSGTGREGEGRLSVSGLTIACSAPEEMGGKGVGMSPEDLLISAVGSCYSATLFGLLTKRHLPVSRVTIEAEGTVTGYPLQSKFARLTVSPTIFGADMARRADYEAAARDARDRCFIGKTIAGNVEYTVGHVEVSAD
ncbi:MAG: OsmC family protein [Alicyclobacillus macrosporangiidus]|uniref:OsmC family protein n=1 Tax=Alicyclobacillus macrosporangiidus TaxID=392015 RepID=UPI0026F101CD|nr:OsmC family protein [Alicyclobacillus macrosporangiidus]MCL6598604.1 OsmC family protein [Alicyclobacillus macrosporangiidus]